MKQVLCFLILFVLAGVGYAQIFFSEEFDAWGGTVTFSTVTTAPSPGYWVQRNSTSGVSWEIIEDSTQNLKVMGSGYTPHLIYFEPVPVTDYNVGASILASTDDVRIGVIARWQDQGNFYTAFYKVGNVYLTCKKGGTSYTLASYTGTWEAGKHWIKLAVSEIDSPVNLQVYFDDDLVINYDDSSSPITGAGYGGMYAYLPTSTDYGSFDNFRISEGNN